MSWGGAALLVALLAQAGPLPADHPPIDPSRSSQARPLPPEHPALSSGAAELPPGHPPATTRPAPSAAELIEQLEKRGAAAGKDKPFDIAFAIGKLYYSQARYKDASAHLGDALARLKPLEALVPRASSAPATDCPASSLPMEERIAAARKKGAGCAQALLLDLQDLRALQANALYLAGDPSAAKAVLDRIVSLQPGNARALLQRALIALEQRPDDVASLERARADLATAQADPLVAPRAGPYLPRVDSAIAAGGFSKLKPAPSRPVVASAQVPPQLTEETIRAFESVERTPELDANLTRLVEEGEAALAKNDAQAALASFRQVMPLQPNDPRLRAGMAWALVSLGRQPMADRVWSVALEDPGAVERLGDTLQAKGNAEGARAVWRKLAADRPELAPRLEPKLRTDD